MGDFRAAPQGKKTNRGLELKITKKRIFFKKENPFDLPRSEKTDKELYSFEKRVFWSGPSRKSRVFRSGKAEKWGAFARHIPVLSLYGSTPTAWDVAIPVADLDKDRSARDREKNTN